MLEFVRKNNCPLLSACYDCLRWETETSERDCKTNQKTEIMPVILIGLINSTTYNTDYFISILAAASITILRNLDLKDW